MLPAVRYDELVAAAAAGASDSSDIAATALRVHPSFRVIALALPPTGKKNWLHPEVMNMFTFHTVPSWTPQEVSGKLCLFSFRSGSLSL